MLAALVIGHKKDSPGARNPASGLSEFAFNEPLSREIERWVEEEEGVLVQRVYRRTWETLPGDINELCPDLVVSLHANSFNRRVSGTEVLHYHRSAAGKALAEILLGHLVGCLGLKNRGLKPTGAEGRGGSLLQKTQAPCLIAEPFFIDNNKDLETALEKKEALARAYADAIREMAGYLREGA